MPRTSVARIVPVETTDSHVEALRLLARWMVRRHQQAGSADSTDAAPTAQFRRNHPRNPLDCVPDSEALLLPEKTYQR